MYLAACLGSPHEVGAASDANKREEWGFSQLADHAAAWLGEHMDGPHRIDLGSCEP